MNEDWAPLDARVTPCMDWRNLFEEDPLTLDKGAILEILRGVPGVDRVIARVEEVNDVWFPNKFRPFLETLIVSQLRQSYSLGTYYAILEPVWGGEVPQYEELKGVTVNPELDIVRLPIWFNEDQAKYEEWVMDKAYPFVPSTGEPQYGIGTPEIQLLKPQIYSDRLPIKFPGLSGPKPGKPPFMWEGVEAWTANLFTKFAMGSATKNRVQSIIQDNPAHWINPGEMPYFLETLMVLSESDFFPLTCLYKLDSPYYNGASGVDSSKNYTDIAWEDLEEFTQEPFKVFMQRVKAAIALYSYGVYDRPKYTKQFENLRDPNARDRTGALKLPSMRSGDYPFELLFEATSFELNEVIISLPGLLAPVIPPITEWSKVERIEDVANFPSDSYTEKLTARNLVGAPIFWPTLEAPLFNAILLQDPRFPWSYSAKLQRPYVASKEGDRWVMQRIPEYIEREPFRAPVFLADKRDEMIQKFIQRVDRARKAGLAILKSNIKEWFTTIRTWAREEGGIKDGDDEGAKYLIKGNEDLLFETTKATIDGMEVILPGLRIFYPEVSSSVTITQHHLTPFRAPKDRAEPLGSTTTSPSTLSATTRTLYTRPRRCSRLWMRGGQCGSPGKTPPLSKPSWAAPRSSPSISPTASQPPFTARGGRWCGPDSRSPTSFEPFSTLLSGRSWTASIAFAEPCKPQRNLLKLSKLLQRRSRRISGRRSKGILLGF